MTSKRPLHPKTSHFCSPVCSSYVLTPHSAFLDDSEAGLGLLSSGKGPSSDLHGNSKSGAILDSMFIISILIIDNCCKNKGSVLCRNWSQGQNLKPSKSYFMVAMYCTKGHCIHKQTLIASYCTTYHGTLPKLRSRKLKYGVSQQACLKCGLFSLAPCMHIFFWPLVSPF
jgi:hypothetical protein